MKERSHFLECEETLLLSILDVPIAETIRGFKEILEGKHDDVDEADFYMKGGIDQVVTPAVA